MGLLSYILWNQDPVLFSLGPVEARWYGLLFAMAFVLGQYVITKVYTDEGKTVKDVERLTLYMVISVVVGARLGHCLFYEPAYYLTHPLDILKVWEGGLASHGATVGIIVAMYLFARGQKQMSWLWALDRIVIVVALGGACIRMGNLMNSEIVGKPTDVPWAFIFAHPGEKAIMASAPKVVTDVHFTDTGKPVPNDAAEPFEQIQAELSTSPNADPQVLLNYASRQLPLALIQYDEAHEHFRPEELALNPRLANGKLTVQLAAVPRHPAQLYEAISTFLIFFLMYAIWARYKRRLPEGRTFGLFVVVLFTLRFLYEFLKENQVQFEDKLDFNMGQLLSVPLVIAGAYILYRSYAAPRTPYDGPNGYHALEQDKALAA